MKEIYRGDFGAFLTADAEASATPKRADSYTSALGYILVVLFACASYALVIGPYLSFTGDVLPRGDPFSYTVNWFRQINHSRISYFGAIETILTGADHSWYRLMNILLAIFSPLLATDPVSLCAINYVLWGLGAAAFFHLGRRLELAVAPSFLIAIIPWLWPTNYGFSEYASTPVLGLDSAFTGALHIAVAMTIVFALDPRRRSAAILAALSIGVAIWGRGNSLPVVGLVVFWPCIIAFVKAVKARDRRTWMNIFFVALIAGGMTIEFYVTYWGPLTGYYGLHVNLLDRHSWSLHEALPYLKNIPGYMMWHQLDSDLTVALSWTSHLIPIATLLAVWRGYFPRGKEVAPFIYRDIAATGAFIYYGTYVANLVLWNDPTFLIGNSLLIWRPMLIGLSLSLIVILLIVNEHMTFERFPLFVVPVFAGALVWGAFWTWQLTPSQFAIGRPKPRVVERFAGSLEAILPAGGRMAFLWLNNWNMPILEYYRLKNNLGEAPLFYDANLWRWLPGDDAKRSVLAGIKQSFAQAAVVIPEFVDDYGSNEPYAIYRLRNDWAPWVNSAEAPRMRVIAILEESPTKRLLVLQREELAYDRGDPFRLPWGNRPKESSADYSPAVVRYALGSRG